ncbi:MAG: SirB2 family protein [bacterium]
MTLYTTIKHIHLTTITISLLFFVGRWLWLRFYKPTKRPLWVRVIPHINDVALFITGGSMVWLSGQYPWVVHWVAIKLTLVLTYIILGFFALKKVHAKNGLTFFIAAVATFTFVITLAMTKMQF